MAFLVVSSDPHDGEEGVPQNANIEVVFSADLDTATIPGNIRIVKESDFSTVSFSWTYIPELRKLVLDPGVDLEPSTWYIVVILPELKDALGEPFGDTLSIRFLTAPSSLPAPQLIRPADKSSIQTNPPTLEWQALADASSYEVQIATTVDMSQLVIHESTTSTSFTPGITLDAPLTYYWRVRGVDATGVKGDWSEIWSFFMGTTEVPSPPTEEVLREVPFLSVRRTTPQEGSYHFEGTEIRVEFDDSIQSASVTVEYFDLISIEKSQPAISQTISANEVILTLSEAPQENTKIEVNVISATSQAGRELRSPFKFIFYSKLVPFYITPVEVEGSELGEWVKEIDRSDLVYLLWRTSYQGQLLWQEQLRFIQKANITPSAFPEGLTTKDLEADYLHILPHVVREFCYYDALYRVGLRIYALKLREADVRRTVAGVTLDVGPGALRWLRDFLTEMDRRRHEALGKFCLVPASALPGRFFHPRLRGDMLGLLIPTRGWENVS